MVVMRVTENLSDEAVDRRVAAEVRAELARQGMTQAQLAEKVGWSASRVWLRLTTGKKAPVPFSVGELAVIAEALDVPVTNFIPQEVAA